jgi:hypothetical protein
MMICPALVPTAEEESPEARSDKRRSSSRPSDEEATRFCALLDGGVSLGDSDTWEGRAEDMMSMAAFTMLAIPIATTTSTI